MTGTHLHLLVNHVPILGAIFALALLLAALVRWAPDAMTRAALVALVVVGAAGAVANFTGEPAEDGVRGLPGVRRDVVHEHEELGETAFLAGAVVGVGALGALLRWRRAPVPRAVTLGFTAGALVVSGLMAYTGWLGGQVRHTEIRAGATPADAMAVEPPRASRPEGGRPDD